jgi:hypothetical protein
MVLARTGHILLIRSCFIVSSFGYARLLRVNARKQRRFYGCFTSPEDMCNREDFLIS